MGIYEYECSDGHVSELFVKLAERPDTIRCAQCGCGTAYLIVSGPQTTFHANDRKAIKGHTVSRGKRT
jgi:hypothetical protein